MTREKAKGRRYVCSDRLKNSVDAASNIWIEADAVATLVRATAEFQQSIKLVSHTCRGYCGVASGAEHLVVAATVVKGRTARGAARTAATVGRRALSSTETKVANALVRRDAGTGAVANA